MVARRIAAMNLWNQHLLLLSISNADFPRNPMLMTKLGSDAHQAMKDPIPPWPGTKKPTGPGGETPTEKLLKSFKIQSQTAQYNAMEVAAQYNATEVAA